MLMTVNFPDHIHFCFTLEYFVYWCQCHILGTFTDHDDPILMEYLFYVVKKKIIFKKTRMTTFIGTKFNMSDDQTNIDKYRLAANITEYHIISKLILQLIFITNLCGPVSHLR